MAFLASLGRPAPGGTRMRTFVKFCGLSQPDSVAEVPAGGAAGFVVDVPGVPPQPDDRARRGTGRPGPERSRGVGGRRGPHGGPHSAVVRRGRGRPDPGVRGGSGGTRLPRAAPSRPFRARAPRRGRSARSGRPPGRNLSADPHGRLRRPPARAAAASGPIGRSARDWSIPTPGGSSSSTGGLSAENVAEALAIGSALGGGRFVRNRDAPPAGRTSRRCERSSRPVLAFESSHA